MKTTRTINGTEYYTSGGAAKVLGVTKPTLLSLCRRGRITHLLFGSCYYLTREWITEYIDESTKIGVATNESEAVRHKPAEQGARIARVVRQGIRPRSRASGAGSLSARKASPSHWNGSRGSRRRSFSRLSVHLRQSNRRR